MVYIPSMKPSARYPIIIITVLLCWFSAIRTAHAYMFMQSMYQSRLFMYRDTVIFLQPDGSITVLALKDGSVLRRAKQPGRNFHTLRADLFEERNGNILGASNGSLFLLDGKTFELLWAQKAVQPLLRPEAYYYSDGNHALAAADPGTGKDIWRVDVGGYGQFEYSGGRIFVLASNHWNADNSFLVCLDAADGRELWRKSAPRNTAWMRLAVSDAKLYVVRADYDGQSKSDRSIREVMVWNHDGEFLESSPPGPGLNKTDAWSIDNVDLHLEGTTYRKRGIPYAESPMRALTAAEQARFNFRTRNGPEGFALPGGGVVGTVIEESSKSEQHDGAANRRLFFIEDSIAWTRKADYLEFQGRNGLFDAVESGDSLVLAYRLGQVECLDRRTGKSRWLYIFPTNRADLSGPYRFMPSPHHKEYYLDSLARYRRETNGIGISGTVIDGDTGAPGTRIIIDPAPVHYYEEFTFLNILTVVLGLSVLVMVTDILISGRFERTGKPALWRLFHSDTRLASAMLEGGACAFMGLFMMNHFGRYSRPLFWLLMFIAIRGTALFFLCLRRSTTDGDTTASPRPFVRGLAVVLMVLAGVALVSLLGERN